MNTNGNLLESQLMVSAAAVRFCGGSNIIFNPIFYVISLISGGVIGALRSVVYIYYFLNTGSIQNKQDLPIFIKSYNVIKYQFAKMMYGTLNTFFLSFM